jgi:hypothetical protein
VFRQFKIAIVLVDVRPSSSELEEGSNMSILLFVIGGIAVVVGAATVAFGIPVNEFSFGNTLILAGTTIGTGGLILVGLGAVVVKLHRAVNQLHRIATAAMQGTSSPAERRHGTIEQPPEVRRFRS